MRGARAPRTVLRSVSGNPAAQVEAMKRVLVVEDEYDLRNAICATLDSSGYLAVPAADGHQALEMIVANRPDLVLTDVMMPRMTGYVLVARLRKLPGCEGLRVILMSSIDPALHPRGPWDAVLHKPFSSEVLLAALDPSELQGPGNPPRR